MFGKTKGSAHEKDEQLPAARQLQDSTAVSSAESDTTEISCIGPGMTVVGKISSEGTLNVLGRVEGELHASIVRISDGAEVEGTIAAQELTIGGRFKGTIQADRVIAFHLGAVRNAKRPTVKRLPIDLGVRTRPVAVTLKNRTLSPVADLFIECARSAAQASQSH